MSSEGRVLMREGRWMVPPEERPANWRQILDEVPAPVPDTLDRAIKATEARVVRQRPNPDSYFPELFDAVEESMNYMGVSEKDENVRIAAHVLMMGLFTRNATKITRLLKTRRADVVKLASTRYAMWGFWHSNYAVHLGPDELLDLSVLLIAMAGAGVIRFANWDGDTPLFQCLPGEETATKEQASI